MKAGLQLRHAICFSYRQLESDQQDLTVLLSQPFLNRVKSFSISLSITRHPQPHFSCPCNQYLIPTINPLSNIKQATRFLHANVR